MWSYLQTEKSENRKVANSLRVKNQISSFFDDWPRQPVYKKQAQRQVFLLKI